MEIVDIDLKSIDSTQKYAKEHREEFAKDKITCISAQEQTAGKGRFNRRWVSPNGGNLYTTFYFQLPTQSLHLSSLGQILVLSITKLFISENLCPKIKWPNDILLGGKKVAGILCEMEFEDDRAHIFLGLGINVNMDEKILESIDQPATSLSVATGKKWDTKALLNDLKKQFLKDFDIFCKEGFTPFHYQFENLMAYKGEPITCFDGEKEWKGICHSLCNDGQLNLYLPNGDIKTLSSGDIHFKTK